MNAPPLVSVLVPLYNKAGWVESTVRSALEQTVDDLEVVVIDDGSTDDSLTVVTAISDPRLSVFSRENRGANATRNELLTRARGELVQFLDADDLLLPGKLERQLDGLKNGADVSLCSVSMEAPAGSHHPPNFDGPLDQLLVRHGVHTAAMATASLLEGGSALSSKRPSETSSARSPGAHMSGRPSAVST